MGAVGGNRDGRRIVGRRTRSLALAAMLGLGLWAVLIFEPGQAITHQGGFFPQLAVVALVVGALGRYAWACAAVLVLLQAGFTLLVYPPL